MMPTPVESAEATPTMSGDVGKRRTSRAIMLATLLLAGLLFVAAFRGVAWAEMRSALREARVELLLASFVALSCACAIRASRWHLLLQAENNLGRSTVFWATAVGYLGNSFLPARAGEAIRLFVISRRTRIGVGYTLATILTERIVDAAVLVLIIFSSLLTLDNLPSWLYATVRGAALLSVGGIAGLFIAPRLEGTLVRLLRRLPLPARVLGMLDTIFHQFLTGVRSLQHLRRGGAFIGLTTAVWCVDTVAALLAARALGLPLTPAQILLLLAALGLASAVPSTPGYVGIYQFVAVTVLLPLGYTRIEALSFILAYQAVTYLVVTVWGLSGLWRLGVVRRVAADSHAGKLVGCDAAQHRSCDQDVAIDR